MHAARAAFERLAERVHELEERLADMEALFDGIPLDQVSTSMTINAPAAVLLLLYELVGEEQGVPSEKLRGTTQNDVLKEYIARGTYIYPPAASLRLITDIFAYCRAELPKWNTISISGYHIQEAGATADLELAYTLADGVDFDLDSDAVFEWAGGQVAMRDLHLAGALASGARMDIAGTLELPAQSLAFEGSLDADPAGWRFDLHEPAGAAPMSMVLSWDVDAGTLSGSGSLASQSYGRVEIEGSGFELFADDVVALNSQVLARRGLQVLTVYDALKGHKFKYPELSVEEASKTTNNAKRETHGAI